MSSAPPRGLHAGNVHIPHGHHFPPFAPEHLTNSLQHLAELAVPASRAGMPGG